LLGGPATFARDNATLNINVYNNNNNNNRTDKKSCVYACCVLGGYTVEAALTVKPVNTVAVARSSVILQCGTDQGGSPPANIAWIRNPGTASEQRVVGRYNCRLNSDFTQYSVISSSYGRCDLVVLDASQELAATYRCVDQGGDAADAELTVIGETCTYIIIIIMLTFIMRLLLQNKNIGAVQKYKYW